MGSWCTGQVTNGLVATNTGGLKCIPNTAAKLSWGPFILQLDTLNHFDKFKLTAFDT